MHHAFKLGDTEHELWLSRGRDGYLLHLGERLIPVAFKREGEGGRFASNARGSPERPDRDVRTGSENRGAMDGSAHVDECAYYITVNGDVSRAIIAVRGDDVHIHLDGTTHTLSYRHPMVRLAAQSQHSADDVIRAPMPGSLISATVRTGDRVARGDPLLVMESMKMETTIAAPRDGLIEAVQVAPGQTFDRDAVLITLQSSEEQK